MDQVHTVGQLLVTLLASGLLGALKWASPKISDRVPNLMWPIALFVLARVGTSACGAVGADCQGNPLNWGPEATNAMALALVGIVFREAAVGLRCLKQRVFPQFPDSV